MTVTTTAQQFSREYDGGRIAQGFRTPEHWEAFLAYVEHLAACPECSQPGPAMWLEGSASWQPTSRLCAEGVRLQRISDAKGCEGCAGVQTRTGHWLTARELADVHAVSHACPRCGATEVSVTRDGSGAEVTRCRCHACPALFTVSAEVDGPVSLRYLTVGHRAA